MSFRLGTGGLGQKVALLVLGVTVFMAVTIGMIGDVMLRRLATDLTQARLPSSLASLDRLVDQGGATVTPIMAADGSVSGILVMRRDAGATVIPASLVEHGTVQKAAVTVEPIDESAAIADMRKNLAVASVLVLVVVGFIGMQLAGGFVEPLQSLAKEVDRLAEGDTDVGLSARSRTDEVGQLARASVKLQEQVIELNELKARLAAAPVPPTGSVLGMLTDRVNALWASTRDLFGRELFGKDLVGKDLFAKDSLGKVRVGWPADKLPDIAAVRTNLTTATNDYWHSFKGWLTDEPRPAKPQAT